MSLKITCILSVFFLILPGAVLAQVEDFEAGMQRGRHQTSPVQIFQAAGDVGGGMLEPGAVFPAGDDAVSILTRTGQCLEYTTYTDGLPPGAYTNWWVMITNPGSCVAPDDVLGSVCGFFDLFQNPEVDSAAFLATGEVVEEDGVGEFHAKVCMGDDLGFPTGGLSLAQGPEVVDHVTGEVTAAEVIGPQHLWGQVSNPQGAFVWSIIKYHGPASENPDVLYAQTHTLLGSCFEGANGHLGANGVVQCFDPQIVVFNPPARRGR